MTYLQLLQQIKGGEKPKAISYNKIVYTYSKRLEDYVSEEGNQFLQKIMIIGYENQVNKDNIFIVDQIPTIDKYELEFINSILYYNDFQNNLIDCIAVYEDRTNCCELRIVVKENSPFSEGRHTICIPIDNSKFKGLPKNEYFKWDMVTKKYF